MTDIKVISEKLCTTGDITRDEIIYLLENRTPGIQKTLAEKASARAREYYGNKVFVRGLIEFTNYCRNDCYYCGIRCGNKNAQRYRLSIDEIVECASYGYGLGFRTIVLQGGEDQFFTDDKMTEIIRAIKHEHPDCAVTLSIGEKSYETYKSFFDAGADRYLLRHETADYGHYAKLHPANLSAENRQRCLFDLKKIGFQTGAGFMVGSPYQTNENIADDLLFLKKLDPEMVGIGPFIPHKDTVFADRKAGELDLVLYLLSIIRLMLPTVLLPATTALGTIDPRGRELGILAGANVVMPNLSPVGVRKKYDLYDNKICTGEEAAECMNCLKSRISRIGYEIVTDRGDNIKYVKEH
ncbi:[FeFe] hydrogenase H-cluster radical SAM maturase HydE [Butyrivibrio sp. AE2032]|uniref:[FeFe] hydrogenase H-cluster radical SAM maturase HydE n=1 Tax=Butyrivibrio sp. AE2032 TaxID=1458463 RepID=UPI000A9FEA41|nr:[FeFe] hydrogenase H-cluster radical SAM maturase HydE [Butyrivibrio sp. AE2032]